MDTINATHYRFNGTVTAFDVREEVIKVNGGEDQVLAIRSSVFGPVVTDHDVVDGFGSTMSLKWIGTVPELTDTTVKSFIEMNFAKSFEEFRKAMSYFVAPSLNFVVADNRGNIGYQMSGMIPVRSCGHTGAWPVPGDGSYNTTWHGFLDFYKDIPWTKNPSKGFVATANNQIVPQSYRFHLTSDYDSGALGYRAARITDMINSTIHRGEKLSLEDMKLIQLDLKSYQARDLVELVLAHIPPSKFVNGTHSIYQALRSWNFELPVGSQHASLYAMFMRELFRLGSWETGEPFYEVTGFLLSALTGNDSACTAYPYGGVYPSSCDDFVVRSLANLTSLWNSSVRACSNSGCFRFEDDAQRWGKEIHKARFESLSLGGSALQCLANRYASQGGDSATVNVGSFGVTDTKFTQDHGAGYRQVVDLDSVGKPEQFQRSLFIESLGQSDRIFSAQYDNMLKTWSNNGYFSMILQSSKHSDSEESQILRPSN
eukprot:gb/GECG01013238.1/.p1 GENE.gb/GECG01013238.1/~~gb/GECG01013238.1/.p1  ORF type:complete len:486 (+),score=43.80 gb/GECG01013238.1/:1-1458(+)